MLLLTIVSHRGSMLHEPGDDDAGSLVYEPPAQSLTSFRLTTLRVLNDRYASTCPKPSSPDEWNHVVRQAENAPFPATFPSIGRSRSRRVQVLHCTADIHSIHHSHEPRIGYTLATSRRVKMAPLTILDPWIMGLGGERCSRRFCRMSQLEGLEYRTPNERMLS
ncbi:hypothetical protein LX32DRAFT_270745 [Colletotrichum zoysiae]|uniref:Uncharacterized protein n=1 Tax=Colletotrichum zoysiae TaxID=1216348 RepID=A0AAD9H2E0_9PEZI|nr:hypothetical protein LX32DRAFT_270745 [Colletotrichum zoysiae]